MALPTTLEGYLRNFINDLTAAPGESTPISTTNAIWDAAGAPDNAVGIDGDWWIDLSTYDLYGPKASGTWPGSPAVSLIGPQGERGIQGPAGAGMNYKGVYSPGTYDIADVVAYQGSTYICTDGPTTELPTNATYWGLVAAKGDTGATGSAGPKGDTGSTGATGAQGPEGPAGVDGADGLGVPAGGTTGQVLAKASNADNDTEWVAQTGGSGDPSDFNLTGAYASLPAAGTAGRIYLPTDSPYEFRDNGSSWDAWLPGDGKVVVPPSAGWTLVNDGGSTIDWSKGYGFLNVVSGSYIRGISRSAPGPTYSAIVLVGSSGLSGENALSIGWSDGSSPIKTATLFIGFNATNWLVSLEYAAVSGWSSEPAYVIGLPAGRIVSQDRIWIKWTYDGADLKWYYALMKGDWVRIFPSTTVLKNAYMSGTPNIFIGRCSAGGAGTVNIYSFETE